MLCKLLAFNIKVKTRVTSASLNHADHPQTSSSIIIQSRDLNLLPQEIKIQFERNSIASQQKN